MSRRIIRRDSDEVKDIKALKSNALQSVATSEKQVVAAGKQVSAFREECESLMAKAEKLREVISKLGDTQSSLHTETDSRKKEIRSLSGELNSLNSEIEAKENDFDLLVKDKQKEIEVVVASKKDALKLKEKTLANISANIVLEEARLSDVKKKIPAVKKELSNAEGLKMRLDTLVKQLPKTEKQVTEAERNLLIVKAETVEANKARSTAIGMKAEEERKLQGLQAQVATEEQRLEETKAKLIERDTEIEKKLKVNRKLRESLEQLERRIQRKAEDAEMNNYLNRNKSD